MDKYLDVRFERVEKALAALIDSIAKYNPSQKLAEDLVAADKELYNGLVEWNQHQINHIRIQQLRAETTALDTQIKDVIKSLWEMRKELKSTPITVYPAGGPKYSFTTAELLNYARRISRNTLPPSGVTNGVVIEDEADPDSETPPPSAEQSALPDTAQSSFMTTTTPNTSFNGAMNTPTPAPPTPADTPYQTTGAPVATGTELPMHLKPMVNLNEGASFYPWPTEEQIRSGALAAYQALVDRGIDPKGYDPDAEENRKRAEEEARKEQEENQRREREEAERRMHEERERMARERERARLEAERRGSVAGDAGASAAAARAAEEKKQFTFLDGLDDDDDDDD
jgi:signal transduction histidine kinase